jgi:hypothetical protein
LVREWGGDKPILSILPKKYFPSGSLGIFELDYASKFNKVDPRFWKLMGEVIPQETVSKLVGDGSDSMLVLLGLMNYKYKAARNDKFS